MTSNSLKTGHLQMTYNSLKLQITTWFDKLLCSLLDLYTYCGGPSNPYSFKLQIYTVVSPLTMLNTGCPKKNATSYISLDLRENRKPVFIIYTLLESYMTPPLMWNRARPVLVCLYTS